MKKAKLLVSCIAVSILAIALQHSSAHAFLVIKTGSGQDIRWTSPSATYRINIAGGPEGGRAAIEAAMDTWSNVTSSPFVFVSAGTTTSTDHGEYDGQNIVTLGPIAGSGTIAVNTFWYNSVTGEMLDSDIRFNSNFSWSINVAAETFDVQNIATHELGHSLALADLYDAADFEKTMYGYSYFNDTGKSTLDADDVAGISYLYPNAPITSADFDGDNTADIAVWRFSTGVWYIYRSSDSGVTSRQWGLGSLGDNVVAGDYDGDRKADIAVWRPSNGVWYIQRSLDGGMMSPQWGLGSLGDVPVPGDYDGDGTTDVAVWRSSNGVWYIQRSSDDGVMSPQWGSGVLNDVPVPGDYDGDGKTDIAVWRPDSGIWYIQRSLDGGMMSPQWGLGTLGDVPVPGDYDGDGKTDVAVWRPSNGVWYLQRSSDGGVMSPQWGSGALDDVAVPGDYDGDGRTDPTVWRPDSGVWYILRSSDGGVTSRQWGMIGDMPIKSGY